MEEERIYAFENVDKYASTIQDNAMYTFFDSGVSSLMIAGMVFDDLIQKIFADGGETEYEIIEGTVLAPCSYAFPTLYFQFEGYWLQVPREDYVLDVSTGEDESACSLLLTAIDAPFNIMGLPVF